MKKFKEDQNVAVLTTKFVLFGKEPITYVYRYKEDGMWEFAGDTETKEADYKVISLEEIIMHDPSVSDVADLELGTYAYREENGGNWSVFDLD